MLFKKLALVTILLLAGCSGPPPQVSGYNIGVRLAGNGRAVFTIYPKTATPDAEKIVLEVSRNGKVLYTQEIPWLQPWDSTNVIDVTLGSSDKPLQEGDLVTVAYVRYGQRSGTHLPFTIPKEPFTDPVIRFPSPTPLASSPSPSATFSQSIAL